MTAKLTELQGEIDKSIIIEEDFHIPFSVIARTRHQKISKDIECLDNMINKLEHK